MMACEKLTWAAGYEVRSEVLLFLTVVKVWGMFGDSETSNINHLEGLIPTLKGKSRMFLIILQNSHML